MVPVDFFLWLWTARTFSENSELLILRTTGCVAGHDLVPFGTRVLLRWLLRIGSIGRRES